LQEAEIAVIGLLDIKSRFSSAAIVGGAKKAGKAFGGLKSQIMSVKGAVGAFAAANTKC
jgi:hypothetical protein